MGGSAVSTSGTSLRALRDLGEGRRGRGHAWATLYQRRFVMSLAAAGTSRTLPLSARVFTPFSAMTSQIYWRPAADASSFLAMAAVAMAAKANCGRGLP
jgi:hypothetical protein